MMDQLVAAALVASLIGGAVGAIMTPSTRSPTFNVNDRMASEQSDETSVTTIEKWRSEKEASLDDVLRPDPRDRWVK